MCSSSGWYHGMHGAVEASDHAVACHTQQICGRWLVVVAEKMEVMGQEL